MPRPSYQLFGTNADQSAQLCPGPVDLKNMRHMKTPHTFAMCSAFMFAAFVNDMGCASSSETATPRDAGTTDAIIVYPLPDTGPSNLEPCDLRKPFGAPVLVPKVNIPGTSSGALSRDELTLYVMNNNVQGFHIYTATRPTIGGDFGDLTQMKGIVNDPNKEDFDPYPSADGTELYFSSGRGGGGFDLYVAARSSTAGTFEGAAPVANVNTSSTDRDPAILPDKSALYFSSMGYSPDGKGLNYKALRSGATFTTPTLVDLGPTSGDGGPVPSADDLTLFFTSARTGSQSGDIWVATRSPGSPKYGAPTNAGDVVNLNSAWNEYPTWLSLDGCRLYLDSDRPGPGDAGAGTYRLYMASRPQ